MFLYRASVAVNRREKGKEKRGESQKKQQEKNRTTEGERERTTPMLPHSILSALINTYPWPSFDYGKQHFSVE